jgi:hypothetical protein
MEELTNYDIFDIQHIFNIDLILCVDFHDLVLYDLIDGSYILNMDNKHWVALFVKNKKGVYFDSYGVIYPLEIKDFCKNIIYNDDTIQSINSVLCGYFCLFFLYWMTNKYKNNLRYTLNNFRALFSDDENNNNKILQSHIKLLYKHYYIS